jgi:5-methylcytosine-specific restriction endonuclease McrA
VKRRKRGRMTRLKRKVNGEVVVVDDTPKVKKAHRKKSARTLRIELLDTLFSEAIRMRDGFTCQRCGHQNKSAQAAHIWTRNNYSTRWDMENALCLCYMCHIKGFHSAHREPAEFLEWAHQRMGDERWEALRARSMATVKVNDIFMDETEQRLREYLRNA